MKSKKKPGHVAVQNTFWFRETNRYLRGKDWNVGYKQS